MTGASGDTVVVRTLDAASDDLEQVARIRWAGERDPSAAADADAFVDAFVAWYAATDTHVAVVAARAGVVVGFGFLAVTARVPSPDALTRCSADVQAVFVDPAHRGGGVGGRIVAALLELGRVRGVEHVTVHGNARAVPLYERAGFRMDPMFLAR